MQPQPVPAIGKRKRSSEPTPAGSTSVQIITGSYERTLHGLVAGIPSTSSAEPGAKQEPATFSDNFLFNAHASSIRCLAVSEASEATAQKPAQRILATGSSDEKINLYRISASKPKDKQTFLDSSSNREIGSLLHHSATVKSLSFPSRSKLVSGSMDNTIAISRTRDWDLLSSIRVPIPKAIGRPSGDTAAPGEVPAGINDVAVHPSAKLALSVGQGERCMRLWNLITGKRGGVLTFDKNMLGALGEGRWRRGEARSVVWSADGEQFAIGFERGVLLYGLDCNIRGMIRVEGTKICRTRYLPKRQPQTDGTVLSNGPSGDPSMQESGYKLAMSTEDGRVLLYDVAEDLASHSTGGAEESRKKVVSVEEDEPLPVYPLIAQLGEVKQGSRIKDFVVLAMEDTLDYLVITGSSDGTVTLWRLDESTLSSEPTQVDPKREKVNSARPESKSRVATRPAVKVGFILGSYETQKRITCLEAFALTPSGDSSTVEAEDSAISGVYGEKQDAEDDFEGFSGDEED